MENRTENNGNKSSLIQDPDISINKSEIEKIVSKEEKPSLLDLEEQNLRIQELKFKVDDLKKSDWKKISTWTGMVAILAAIMGIIGQGIIYQIKSAKAEEHLDSVLLKQRMAEDVIAKAHDNLNIMKDSVKMVRNSANQEYASYQSNIANARHTLDSIKSFTADISNKADHPQIKQINRLIKETNQTLNTVVEIPPINMSKSSALSSKVPNDSTATHQASSTIDYPDDPQKGKWGMVSERNGRKITATVTQLSGRLYSVKIQVLGTDPNNPLTGKVVFHLHNTFRNPNPSVEAEDNEAVLTLMVYGSFTVGAETDNGKTKLELDLAELPNVPKEFKDN